MIRTFGIQNRNPIGVERMLRKLYEPLISWRDPSPEEEFLVACCFGAAERALAIIRELDSTGRLKWATIRKRLRVYPFANDACLAWPVMAQLANSLAIPTDILEYTGSTFERTRYTNQQLLRELIDVARALNCARIPFLVSKGPALILLDYYDLGTRRNLDLDLLVPRDCVDDAERCLRHLGFRTEEAHESRRSFYLNNHHHLPPLFRIRESQKIFVEIQWRTSNHPHSSRITERYWATCGTANWEDCEMLVPHPAFMFVHGVLDMWMHEFQKGLRTMCDLWLLAARARSQSLFEMVDSEICSLEIEPEMKVVLVVMQHLTQHATVWPTFYGSVDLPDALPRAVEECLLRKCSDRILTWKLLARRLSQVGGVRSVQRVTSRVGGLASQRSVPSNLYRILRQLWRIAMTVPKASCFVRNEHARLVLENWNAVRMSASAGQQADC